jgi:circadian clock protein KaiC
MADLVYQPLERVPTGISNLDIILGGGLLRGGMYMVSGTPGAGKTILGNQITFNHAANGGSVVFMTLLAETHARMLSHIQSLSFFDPARIGSTIYYVSGYSALEQDGLQGLLSLIRRLVRERKTTFLIIDGILTAQSVAETPISYRRFLHELQVLLETAGCTSLLLAQPSDNVAHLEHTMVEGVFRLTDTLIGPRPIREIEVSKFRGSDYLRGRHAFEITSDGIAVHPRIETLFTHSIPPLDERRTRMTFGVQRLDEMLNGGLLSGSSTILLGTSGTGKSLLGLHFLNEGAIQGENALYFGFYETPSRLVAKGKGLGLPLENHIERGLLDINWQPSIEHLPDALVETLFETIRRKKIKRLFLDGIESLDASLIYPERRSPFMAALMNELRALGVTTLFSSELPDLFSDRIAIPVEDVSSLVDNIIFLRYVELNSQLYRLISILKARESGYDSSIREFGIDARGIYVADTFESAQAILTGIARPVPGSRPSADHPPEDQAAQS